MTERCAVVFSGVPGTSKSSIADHLSWNFDMGILRSDSVRFEVKEDLRVEKLSIGEDLDFSNVNQNGALEEFEHRLRGRRRTILTLGKMIILDGSVDRKWSEIKEELLSHGYEWYMINMELSRKFLEDLYSGTGREFFIPQLDSYLQDHASFLERFKQDVDLEINDNNFRSRLVLASNGLKQYLGLDENAAVG